MTYFYTRNYLLSDCTTIWETPCRTVFSQTVEGSVFFMGMIPMKNHSNCYNTALCAASHPDSTVRSHMFLAECAKNHWRNRRNERPPKERFAAFTVRPETQIEAASLCDSMHRCFRVATFFHVALRLDNYIRELFFCFPFRSNEDTRCITIDSLGSQLQRSNFPRVTGQCFPKFLIFDSLSQIKCKKVRIDSFSCFLYEYYVSVIKYITDIKYWSFKINILFKILCLIRI